MNHYTLNGTDYMTIIPAEERIAIYLKSLDSSIEAMKDWPDIVRGLQLAKDHTKKTFIREYAILWAQQMAEADEDPAQADDPFENFNTFI